MENLRYIMGRNEATTARSLSALNELICENIQKDKAVYSIVEQLASTCQEIRSGVHQKFEEQRQELQEIVLQQRQEIQQLRQELQELRQQVILQQLHIQNGL